jgi:hypothetical protein
MPFQSLRMSSLVMLLAQLPLATSHATSASSARSLVEASPLASARANCDSPSRAEGVPLHDAAVAAGRGSREGLSGRWGLFLFLFFVSPPSRCSERWSDGMLMEVDGDGDDKGGKTKK